MNFTTFLKSSHRFNISPVRGAKENSLINQAPALNPQVLFTYMEVYVECIAGASRNVRFYLRISDILPLY